MLSYKYSVFKGIFNYSVRIGKLLTGTKHWPENIPLNTFYFGNSFEEENFGNFVITNFFLLMLKVGSKFYCPLKLLRENQY